MLMGSLVQDLEPISVLSSCSIARKQHPFHDRFALFRSTLSLGPLIISLFETYGGCVWHTPERRALLVTGFAKS